MQTNPTDEGAEATPSDAAESAHSHATNRDDEAHAPTRDDVQTLTRDDVHTPPRDDEQTPTRGDVRATTRDTALRFSEDEDVALRFSEDEAARGISSEDGLRSFAGGFRPSKTRLRLVVFCVVTFLVAVSVRLFTLQDAALEAGKVQTAVTGDYKYVGRLLLAGGVASFFDPASPLADPNTLGHPPGYSLLIAVVMHFSGEPDGALQLIQIFSDAAAAVVLLLIVAELLPSAVALLAGLLSAVAPQFAWNSVVLLPDTLAALPLLLALYCLVHARRGQTVAWSLAAGVLVGVSCWLRANAMLLAPFLALVLAFAWFGRGGRLRFAAALLAGALLSIAPLTVRNALVLGRFVPLSLGAGQTLLEGIADYDKEGRFGIPRTDLQIMRQEAAAAGRPDYAETLFGPEGVARERARLARGFAVIRSHPVWFAGVMARRAVSMLRLERVPRISPSPPVSHALAGAEAAPIVWSNSPAELAAGGAMRSGGATISVAPDGQTLALACDESKYGRQFDSAAFPVKAATDYLLSLPVKMERGRISISVTYEDDQTALVSTIVEAVEGSRPEEQPTTDVHLPFISLRDGSARFVVGNAASGQERSFVRFGRVELRELGPAAGLWMRLPRTLLRVVQTLFLTAALWPLALAGALLLARARRWRTLAFLLCLPAYYMCVQSALHTEYRYVLAIHYSLFTLAAVALYWAGQTFRRRLRAPKS